MTARGSDPPPAFVRFVARMRAKSEEETEVDSYRQRRLDAALLARGHEGGWRTWLLQQRHARRPAVQVTAELVALGVPVDARTLQRWTRQAAAEKEQAAATAAGQRARQTRANG